MATTSASTRPSDRSERRLGRIGDLPGKIRVAVRTEFTRPVVARLNGELVKIMYSSEMKDRLNAMGTDPVTSTPEEFAAYIRQEIAKWGDVVRKAGLKAD